VASTRLVLPADHEAGDVLQEHQRHGALVAQLDEVRALQRGLAEQDAVVGDDAHRVPVDPGEPGDEGDDSVELVGVIGRLLRRADVPRARRPRRERGDDAADDAQRVHVVFGEVVGDAGHPRVQVAAA
jgi:hypothetical protein